MYPGITVGRLFQKKEKKRTSSGNRSKRNPNQPGLPESDREDAYQLIRRKHSPGFIRSYAKLLRLNAEESRLYRHQASRGLSLRTAMAHKRTPEADQDHVFDFLTTWPRTPAYSLPKSVLPLRLARIRILHLLRSCGSLRRDGSRLNAHSPAPVVDLLDGQDLGSRWVRPAFSAHSMASRNSST